MGNSSSTPERASMEGMIANSNRVCDMALDPGTPGVPRKLLEDCHGVVLISVVEAGFVFSGNVGTGVVMRHDVSTGKWSPPSAIGLMGIGWGLLAGAEVKEILIVLVDEYAMSAMCGGGQVKLGGQLGVTAGPVGREMEGSLNMSTEGAGITFTYSFSQGLFAGIGLEGAILAARTGENDRFYSMEGTTPKGILFGEEDVTLPKNSGVDELHRKLDLMKEGKTVSAQASRKVRLDR